MGRYLIESFDSSDRYATERYQGAAGRNWWNCDPTLQLLMRRHLGDGLAWATPHLDKLGALMGGPVAEWAEETDRNPPRLEKLRPVGPRRQPGRDAGVVHGPGALLANSFSRTGVRGRRPGAGVESRRWLLRRRTCSTRPTSGWAARSAPAAAWWPPGRGYAPADVRDHVLAKFASG